LTIDRIALEVAKLEDDQMALQFKIKDAEWTLKNTPKEIAKIEAQIRILRKGDTHV
jgi:cell division protein FtsB